MASKNITRKISIFINGKQVENNLGSVGRAVGTLRRELKKLTPGTQAFIDKSKKLKNVKRQYALIKREIEGVPPLFKRMTKGVGGFLGAFGIGLGITGVIRGVQNLTTANVELGEAQADVQKTTGLTKTQIDELTKSLKKIDTRTGITELLGLAESAGRLNIKGKKDIEAFVRATDKAFVALGDSLEGTAADIGLTLGKLAGNFDLDKKYGISDAMNKIGSSLNELGANSKASEGPIVDFTRRLAGVSAQAEISLPNIAALGALFDENGQSVEVSATTFNKLLPAIGKDVERFAKIAGLNVKDFKKIVETDAFEALKLVAKGAKSNQRGLLGLTETLKDYGIDSARAASIVGILSSKTDRLTELQKISNNAFNKGTSLTQEFNVKNQTLGAILEKIGNTISQKFTGSNTQDFLKGIATGFLSILTPAKDLSKEFFESKNNIAALESNINPLLDRYDDLKEKTTLTKDEQVELNNIILKVAKDIPTAITQFDEYGKAMDISSTAAKAFITQQQNLLKVKNRKAIEQATDQLNLQNHALKTLNHTYQLGADGVLRYFEAPKGIAPAGQDFLTKATAAQIKAFADQGKAIKDNIDGYTALIAKLSGEKTATEKAAEADKIAAAEKAKNIKAAFISLNSLEEELSNLTKKQGAVSKEAAKELQPLINAKKVQIEDFKRFINESRIGMLGAIETARKINVQVAQATIKDKKELQAKILKINLKATEDKIKLIIKMKGKARELDAEDLEKIKKLTEVKFALEEEINNNKLTKIANFETRKRELLNQIDLENAITEEEKQTIKATQDTTKELAEIDKLKINETKKEELKKLIVEKYIKTIDNIVDKAAKNRAKKKAANDKKELNDAKKLSAKKIEQAQREAEAKAEISILEIEYQKKVDLTKMQLAQQLGNALLGLLGNSLVGKLTAIALDAVIEVAKIKIATSAGKAINLAAATSASAFDPTAIPRAKVRNKFLTLDSKLSQSQIIASSVISGLNTVLTSNKGFYKGGFTGNLGFTDQSGHEVAGVVHANEYVIPKVVLDQTDVAPVVQYLEAKRTQSNTFADGGATTPTAPSFTAETSTSLEPQSNNEQLITALERFNEILEKLEENGITAYMDRSLQSAKLIRDDIKDYETLRNKNKI